MPKRARSDSSTAPTDEGDSDADCDVSRPAKRSAHSDPLRSRLSLFPIDTDSAREYTLPLTRKNLTRHTLNISVRHMQPSEFASDIDSPAPSSTSSPFMSARSGSPARSAWDTRVTLQAYGGINVVT